MKIDGRASGPLPWGAAPMEVPVLSVNGHERLSSHSKDKIAPNDRCTNRISWRFNVLGLCDPRATFILGLDGSRYKLERSIFHCANHVRYLISGILCGCCL